MARHEIRIGWVSAVGARQTTTWRVPACSLLGPLELQFRQSVTFDTVMAMEWTTDRQLVRKFAVKCYATVHGWGAQEADRTHEDRSPPAVGAPCVRLNILSSAHCRTYLRRWRGTLNA